MKKILIINGHPDTKSFNYALAHAYKQGAAETNAIISTIDVAALDFNPNLQYGYRQRTELEPDLLTAIDKIKAADHLVWVFPMWWYGTPAILKGFIDRTFLPVITYQPVADKPLPEKLLKGKTGHIIITADTPRWYDRFFLGSPALNQFRKGTLQFCGVNPVSVTYIGPMRDRDSRFYEQQIKRVRELGKRGK